MLATTPKVISAKRARRSHRRNFIVDQRALANNVNMKLVSVIVTLALFHSVAKANRECMSTIKAGSGAVEVKDDNTTTLVKPGERFIVGAKAWRRLLPNANARE